MKKYKKEFNVEEFIASWINDNLSYKEMANKFNMSISSIKLRIKDLNLHKTKEQHFEKIYESMNQKYGVNHPSQLPGYSEKIKATYKNRTGYDHPLHNPIVKNQIMQTCLEKYGVANPMQNSDVMQKARETCLEKYGVEYALQNTDIYNNWCDNYESITGYRNPSLNPEVKNKRTQTFIQNFGVTNPALSKYNTEQLELLLNKDLFCKYIVDNNCNTIAKLCDSFNVVPSTIYKYIREYNIEDIINFEISALENEVLEFIRNLGVKADRTRMIIPPQEIDIYCEDYNIGIEFNGDYWHSSLKKNKNYHFDKSKKCQDKNIRLIHIYEHEWRNQITQNIIKSMLKVAFGKIDNRIYARNCEIREVTNTEAKSFNDHNHLQGHRNAQLTYGLYYNNELMQLMSFTYDKSKQWWEIIRGCPGSNNIVIGGVSKLFCHFIKQQNPDKIFSYCDFNKFDGNGYEAIGMKFIGYTGPDMKWLMKNGKVVNRQPSKHSELKNDAMAKIWGAGSKKYLWEK